MRRYSSIIYDSWLEGAEILTDDKNVLGEVALAIWKYSLRGEEYDGENKIVKSVFIQAKPQIDANNNKSFAGSMSHGGGAPKGNQNARKKTTQKQPKNNPKTTQKQPKNNPKTTQKTTQKQLVDLESQSQLIDSELIVEKITTEKQPKQQQENNQNNNYKYKDKYKYEYKDNINLDSSAKASESSSSMVDDAASESRKIKLEKTRLITELVEYYNSQIIEKRSRLPSCVMPIPEHRISAIGARIDKYGEDAVRKVIDLAVSSNFLNEKKFGLDWIMGPKNFPKVLEEKYNDEKELQKQEIKEIDYGEQVRLFNAGIFR